MRNTMQNAVDEWAQKLTNPYWQPLEILARLTEETGEVARALNQRFGPKKKKSPDDTADIEEELGDILFTVACLANSLNIDLDTAFSRAMEKVHVRDVHVQDKRSA